ncbi:ATP-dependent Clp protease ATP-binding subunit ClpA [Streptacidiphilus sp. MAP12-33]|uniref:Clp protease N-terminal domain-containing protein n=1 Tax=Streptacidiphilus sp. MAP12-33 TaxID=3156266 RepID=UPI0035117217
MFERFTADCRRTVVLAQEEARMLFSRTTGSEHLLLGLLGLPGGTVATVLAQGGLDLTAARAAVGSPHSPQAAELDAEALDTIGIDLDAVREKVETVFGAGALSGAAGAADRRRQGARVSGGHLPFTADAKKVLELSLREALAARSREIRPEHLFLGLLRTETSPAAVLLRAQGFDLDDLRAQVLAALA